MHGKLPGFCVKYKVHLSQPNKGNCFRASFCRKSLPPSYRQIDREKYREGTGEIELSLEYSSLKLEASYVDWEALPAFGFINNKVNLFWQRNLCFVNSPCLQTLSVCLSVCLSICLSIFLSLETPCSHFAAYTLHFQIYFTCFPQMASGVPDSAFCKQQTYC
jgi:hypothetical protein